MGRIVAKGHYGIPDLRAEKIYLTSHLIESLMVFLLEAMGMMLMRESGSDLTNAEAWLCAPAWSAAQ